MLACIADDLAPKFTIFCYQLTITASTNSSYVHVLTLSRENVLVFLAFLLLACSWYGRLQYILP